MTRTVLTLKARLARVQGLSLFVFCLLPLLLSLMLTPQVRPQRTASGAAAETRPTPRLEAVADTRLLMDGLNQANFQGLLRSLREKPASGEAWTFARGQALLIAETGNLLLLRPPRNEGRSLWLERAVELRTKATSLARAAADRDYTRCRTALAVLAASCNRCHQSFRVPIQLQAFPESADREVPVP
jgi:hypothetical protein